MQSRSGARHPAALSRSRGAGAARGARRHHGIKPEQAFVGNGSDEVLAHTFVALLKQPKPLLFPDVTYSFYPVWAQLFGLVCERTRSDDAGADPAWRC